MSEPTETLTFEPRDPVHALIRIDQYGAKTEILLSEANIAMLNRLTPQYFRKILAAKTAKMPGVTVTLSLPITDVRLNTDIHQSEILLTISDRYSGEADYSIDPVRARHLAERLVARAAEVETVSKTTTKQ
jgi:hypothetical protein